MRVTLKKEVVSSRHGITFPINTEFDAEYDDLFWWVTHHEQDLSVRIDTHNLNFMQWNQQQNTKDVP